MKDVQQQQGKRLEALEAGQKMLESGQQALEPTFRTSLSHLSHFLCLPGGAVKSPHQQRRLL
jgi:hypothetical protein